MDGGDSPSKNWIFRLGFDLFHLFHPGFEIIWSDLVKDGEMSENGGWDDELLWTSSAFLPGNWLAVNLSTHFSSSSEVVACQRYKQLNYTA